jgi:mannan endo-1,4-beta-mannosidase
MKNLNFIKFLFVIITLILMHSCAQKPEPVNHNATKELRYLLAYLYEIAGEKTLSGQHNYAHELTRSTDTVISWTGKTPVVWGFDLRDGNRWEPTIDEAIRQHRKGAVLTGMSHMSRPFDGPEVRRSTWQKITDEQWEEMLTPETELYDLLIARMDKIAEGLIALQENNIPVLWRPFHEMNGIWFWWGNRPGPEGFERLWKLMYDRYTNHHGLNNLVWVWNPNAPRDWEDDEAYDYHLFYPGHEYVDVLAADVYKNDFKQSHHDDLLTLAEGRPIALGEVGVLPTPKILEQQPMWTWFMCWAAWIWRENTPEQTRELYESPRVLSLDDM